MTEKQETAEPKQRTQIKDLPKEQKELSEEEQKKVKGGMGDFYSYDGARRTNNQNQP